MVSILQRSEIRRVVMRIVENGRDGGWPNPAINTAGNREDGGRAHDATLAPVPRAIICSLAAKPVRQ